MPSTIELLDLVRIRESVAIPSDAQQVLAAGSVGTVVLLHDEPSRGYDVEFFSADGSTVALVRLRPDQVAPTRLRCKAGES